MCVGCGAKKDKSVLIRLTRSREGVVIDRTGRLQGRGAYVCPSPDCVQSAIKKRRLARILGPEADIELERLMEETVNQE